MSFKTTYKISNRQDEELLLAEEDVVTEKKRKPTTNILTNSHKKLKTLTGEVKSSKLVEVKTASGKSMFVNKVTLGNIMASKALQKTATLPPTCKNEKLERKTINATSFPSAPFSPRRTRSCGF